MKNFTSIFFYLMENKDSTALFSLCDLFFIGYLRPVSLTLQEGINFFLISSHENLSTAQRVGFRANLVISMGTEAILQWYLRVIAFCGTNRTEDVA